MFKKYLLILYLLTLHTDNFPPNITAITEMSNTSSLQDNRILQLEVGATYTYEIQASDPNEDVIMYSLLYDGLGASITEGKCNCFIIVSTASYSGCQLEVGTTYTYEIKLLTLMKMTPSCTLFSLMGWETLSPKVSVIASL